jgi:enoyl-CoA hydratase
MSLVLRQNIGRVAVLSLNNAPANGYSHAMHRELDAHIVDIRFDAGVDVVVLRGAGEKFFCAGADINYLRSLNPEQKYAFCLHANETLLRMEHTPKLVIGALNGHCVGGGLEIALACDLRIGRASGDKPNLVGLPEVNLGVLPGTGGTQRLSRILGRAKALQWMVEGRNVSVEEAADAGLIHQVLPAEGWWEAVLAYAQSFCQPQRSATAVGLIKRAVLGGSDLPLESGLALERELQQRLFSGADAREGLAAFVEKRKPHFTGGPGVAAGGGHGYAGGAGFPDVRPEDRVIAHPEDVRRPDAGRTRTGDSDNDDRPANAGRGTEDREPPEIDPFDTGRRSSSSSGGPSARMDGKIDISRTRLQEAALNLVGRDLVEKHMMIPVKLEGEVLVVAIAKPTAAARQALEEETGRPIKLLVADELDIAVAIAGNYRA